MLTVITVVTELKPLAGTELHFNNTSKQLEGKGKDTQFTGRGDVLEEVSNV